MRASEFSPKMLVIFDIDDTLVHTQTEVHVIKDGQIVNSLNSHEFTHYKLQPGESFDFENFRNAKEFFEKSKPIIPMMNQLKRDIARGNKVVMVTARADFDDKELFLDTFRKYHVDIDKVHVYRAGNMKSGSTEERKRVIIKNLLDQGEYSKAVMYDDAKPNLELFVSLKREHPQTKFYAWHVNPQGEASEYLREDLDESHDAVMYKSGHMMGSDKKMIYFNWPSTLGRQLVSFKKVNGNWEPNHEAAEPYLDMFLKIINTRPELVDSDSYKVDEKWSTRYKRSINCSNPKGFSQKAHCAGRKKSEDQHPNEKPIGPETKPTMPKGTIRIKVSDVYDWYKLGQHISDLKGLGKHDFGKGPPEAVISFGSEQEEHEYVKLLQKLGLEIIDVDPGAADAPGVETDPTYNTENFADGKNPGRKGLAKRSGVNCKQSVTKLRKIAKNSSGEKARMAHWCANMKSGRSK